MIKTFVSFLLVLTIAYFVSRYGLGNPYAGLGSYGFLNASQVKELQRAYGLAGPLGGFLEFLRSFSFGGLPSMSFGEPSLSLALSFLENTLTVTLPAFIISIILSWYWVKFLGPKVPRVMNALAFLPEYFYAVLTFLSSWYLGWPSPLPSTSFDKIVAYMVILIAAEFPKALKTIAALYRDAEVKMRDQVLLFKAIGLDEDEVRSKILRITLPSIATFSLTSLAMLLERSAFIEPFIKYVGIGNALYSAVVNADVTLAAYSFTTIGAVAIALTSLAEVVEKLLDPRLRA